MIEDTVIEDTTVAEGSAGERTRVAAWLEWYDTILIWRCPNCHRENSLILDIQEQEASCVECDQRVFIKNTITCEAKIGDIHKVKNRHPEQYWFWEV